MEVEQNLFIGKRGAGEEITLKSNFGFFVITLRHVDMLIKNSINVNCFGINVDVPKPEAYVLQKIVINASRDRKKEKDNISIRGLWDFLNWDEFRRILKSLSNKEQKAVEKYMEEKGLAFS